MFFYGLCMSSSLAESTRKLEGGQTTELHKVTLCAGYQNWDCI